MENKNIHLLASLSLSLFVPAPARFYCGLALVSEFFLLMIFGTFSKFFIKKILLPHVENVLLLFLLVSFSLFFQTIFFALSPSTSFQLQFAFYFPVFSAFVLQNFLNENENKLIWHSFLFSIFALAIFLIRDIVGFGTISFFEKNGIAEIFLWKPILPFSFFATVPGGIMLVALVIILYQTIQKKFSSIKNLGDEK